MKRLSNDQKVGILLKLLEENKKQVEWVKEQDFRIVYYMILAIIAVVTWIVTAGVTELLSMVFNWSMLALYLLSSVMLLRNHERHSGLNREFKRISKSLGLFDEGKYGEGTILIPGRKDWAFPAGRLLYWFFLTIAGSLGYVVVNFLAKAQN